MQHIYRSLKADGKARAVVVLPDNVLFADGEGERWSCYSYDQIAEEGKAHSLDLGLIRDDSVLDYNDLPDPIESGEECIAALEEAVDLLQSVVKELKMLEGKG